MILQYNFTLPWPPSANRYWRHVGHKVLISKEARIYKETLKKLSLTWNFEQLKEDVAILIYGYPPDNRRRDLDNLLKVTLDALCDTAIFLDDSQITSIFIEKLTVKKPGFLEIFIGPASNNTGLFLDKMH